MKRASSFLLTLLFTVCAALAQDFQPDPDRVAAWEEFKSQEGETWNIRWNDRTGTPRTIRNGRTGSYAGNAEQAARAFLSDYHELFALQQDLSDLQHTRSSENRYGIKRARFQQKYEDIRVYGATLIVQIQNRRVSMVNGFYYPDIDVPTFPSVSEAETVRSARNSLNIPPEQELDVTAELVIWPGEEQYHLAWRIILFSVDPITDWEFVSDAHNGEELHRHNRITHVTGTGNIYPTHPDISSVTTENLYRLDGDGTLSGSYVSVENDAGTNAFSANHNFQYNTTSTHFDEVNVYYHVDDFRHNFIEGLGSMGNMHTTAHVHSNDPPGPNNAWFLRTNQHIYFGDGTGACCNSFAREDKVIHHEYGHAVIFEFNEDITSTATEMGAISEGVPDYWAGAHTGRSVIGDYAAPAFQRDMANPEINSYQDYENERDNVFPIGQVPPHDGGEFFSAVLWDIRNSGDINGSQADFLVFDVIDALSSQPDFLEFRDAMMASDDASFNGDHEILIQNTFADWGIGTHPLPPPPSVSISGPSNMFQGSSDTFTANASGGVPPYSYQWYHRHETACSSCWTPAGSNSSTYLHTAGPPNGEFIRVVVTDSTPQTGEDIHFMTIM
ncbi:MAG: M36 family metallopeptidase, partial [Cyclonatronaceae bacterium]